MNKRGRRSPGAKSNCDVVLFVVNSTRDVDSRPRSRTVSAGAALRFGIVHELHLVLVLVRAGKFHADARDDWIVVVVERWTNKTAQIARFTDLSRQNGNFDE
jgi:hypothetical protein